MKSSNTRRAGSSLLMSTFVLMAFSAFGQELKVIPPSPNSASLGVYGTPQVNMAKGLPSPSIPLFELDEKGLPLSVSLSYFYEGYRPANMPGIVGSGWSLRAGGVITRTVRGRKDEIPSQGYFDNASNLKVLIDDYLASPAYDPYLDEYVKGSMDGEPDLFSFNFGNYSGTFFWGEDGQFHVASQQKIKISKVESNAAPNNFPNVGDSIIEFTIVVEDGTKYIFRDCEYSSSSFSGNSGSVGTNISAWYISEIIGVKGQKIEFNYTTASSSLKRYQYSYSESYHSQVNSDPYTIFNTSTEVSNGIVTNTSHEIFLQSIETNNWSLNFTYADLQETYQAQTSYNKQLTFIELVDHNQDFVKKVGFTYEDPQIGGKFYLESVIHLDVTNQIGEKFNLNYYSTNIQPPNSPVRSVDEMGFYNGIGNSSLLPGLGGDRRGKIGATIGGALKEIIYPSGGKTKYYYELNDWFFVKENNGEGTTIVEEDYTYSVVDGQIMNNPQIEILEDTQVDILVNHDNAITALTNCPSYMESLQDYTLTPKSGNPAPDYDLSDFLIPTGIEFCIGQPSSQSNDWGNGNILTISVKVYRELNTNFYDGFGLRLSKVESISDGITTIYDYDYTIENGGNQVSSGVRQALPEYSFVLSTPYPTNSGWGNYAGYTIKSDPFNSTIYSDFYYKRISETVNNSFKTVYEFTDNSSPNDYNDELGTPLDFTVGLSWGSNANYSVLRGLEKEKKIINNADQIVSVDQTIRKAKNDYKNSNFFYSTPAVYVNSLGSFTYYQYPSGQPVVVPMYFSKIYDNVSFLPYLKERITTRYSEDGTGTPVINKEFFYYENPDHLQLTRLKSVRSNGDTLINTYRYAYDYENVPGKTSFIQRLIDSNRVSDILESYAIIKKSNTDSTLVSAQATTFKTYTGNSNKPSLLLPYKTYTMNEYVLPSNFTFYNGLSDEISSSHYYESLKYEDYNNNGNVRSVLKNQNQKVSYLWAYGGMYPVAEIQNANWAEVGPLIPSGEMNLINDQSSASIETKLNTIRGALPNALVSSYLYRPLIGMTKTIAPNGLTTSYSYDTFNRLMEVKDHNQNIIKRYDYHFENQ